MRNGGSPGSAFKLRWNCTMNQDQTSSRRQFLQTGVAATGALVLGASALQAAENAAPPAAGGQPDVVLKMDEHKDLSKVGGYEVVTSGDSKIIVVHKEDGTFAACSAICTHRGCEVAYSAAEKVLVCPCHGAKFGLDGKVLHGPAKRDLKTYKADNAVAIELG